MSLKNVCGQCKNKIVVLSGDFNLPHIDWQTLTVNRNSNQPTQHNYLLDISNDIQQIQNSPTREGHNLDLFFTNAPSLITSCFTAPGVSDHDIIITDTEIQPKYNKTTRRKIYNYNKAQWDKIKSETSQLSDNLTAQNRTTEETWNDLKVGILNIIQKHVPSKLSSKTPNQRWISAKLKKNIKKKHKLHQKAKATMADNDWKTYKQHRSKLQKEIRNAHWEYVNNSLTTALKSNNTKPFWKYIKSKKNENIGISALSDDGNLYYDSKAKAEILNRQFQSVFTKEEINENLPDINTESYPPIPDLQISTEGVQKLLAQVDPKKASGPDGIPNIVLKVCSKELAPVISHIFRKSIETGELPTDWRNAHVTPIYKKGNKHHASNYRPISLTCVCCKILEHIIFRHIMTHMEKHKILTEFQHGFRSKHSCETQLITTINDLIEFYDKKHHVDLIILDFSKAFDTVPHRKLLQKLSHYGVTGNTHSWIKNFLTNRNQSVIIEGITSSPCHVESGVPQGTVLGPLLFLCHINDLPASIKSTSRLFADDSLVYRAIKTEHDHAILQNDLDQLSIWAEKWGMKFNVNKCFVMSINRKKQSPTHTYTIENHTLEKVSQTSYLGITLCDTLKWSAHIDKICARANSVLGFLRRNLQVTSTSLRETAYKTLVRSILEYAATVWDPYLKKDVNKIEKVQHRGANFVSRYNKHGTAKTIQQLGWESLEHRRKEQRLVLFYKTLHDGVAIDKNTLNIQPNPRTQRTSNTQCMKRLTSTTDTKKYSFVARTVPDWNSLDNFTVESPNVDEFKRRLRIESRFSNN